MLPSIAVICCILYYCLWHHYFTQKKGGRVSSSQWHMVAFTLFWRQRARTLSQAQGGISLIPPHGQQSMEMQNMFYKQDPGLWMGLVIHYAESSDFSGLLLPQQQLSFPVMYGSIPTSQRYRKEDNTVSNPWRKRHLQIVFQVPGWAAE